MDSYGVNKATSEIEQAFMYTELSYLLRVLGHSIRSRTLNTRVSKSTLMAFINDFENDATFRMLATGPIDEPSLLSDDVIMILLIKQKNVWAEAGLKAFIDICTKEIEPDKQGRVYIPTWFKAVEACVESRKGELLLDRDKYRGMI